MTDKKIKVILAEDDKFISKAYLGGLQRAGFEVFHASDGNHVMEILKENKPDIILMDVIMPDKNGFETIEEIKLNEEYKDIPIIVLSNLGQETDIEKGKQLGAVDYLIKANFSVAEVVKKINEHLD